MQWHPRHRGKDSAIKGRGAEVGAQVRVLTHGGCGGSMWNTAPMTHLGQGAGGRNGFSL